MRSWRWGVVAAVVAGLVALPSLAGELPVRSGDLSAQELRDRVRGSDEVAWSGYGESRGRLVLPDVRELGELPGLFAGTTRTRAWWRGPADWRVDALTLVGEVDTTRDADGGWSWSSADRRAVRIVGDLDVRLPHAGDLLAPALGRRLAGTADVGLGTLPARRVAGRSAAGLRLTPRDRARTTVRSVDLWVEPSTGLVLQVEVRAAGRDAPALSALLLDLDLATPPPARTAFEPPLRAAVLVGEARDVASAADRFAPYALPASLAELPRRARSALSAGGGVGTYGDGFSALAVLPLPRDVGRRLLSRIGIDPEGDGTTARVSTPLVNGLVGTAGEDRAYLVVGTVPDALLDRALGELRASPPPLRDAR